MAQPEDKYKPRIIVQTDDYRVIVKANPPFEGSQRKADVVIEERRSDGMGEKYWHPVHNLFNTRSGMTKDERLMRDIFEDMAKVMVRPILMDENGLEPPNMSGFQRMVESVERRPKLGPKLADMLTAVGLTISGSVTVPPDMPFDNRGNAVGLVLTPGLISDLRNMFPGIPYELEPIQLVAKLLERAAQELRQ